MDDFRLWKREEAQRKEREGLTGRGIVGCIGFLVSGGAAYLIFHFVLSVRQLRHDFNIPGDWPDWLVAALTLFILFIAIQAITTVILSVYWRMSGRDKKVGDKMQDLLEKWDEIDY